MRKQNSKVVLITGASSGIGFDAAQTLARQGHKVYAAARRVELMEPLKREGVKVLRMDVTERQSMEEGVKAVLDMEGRIDVLVNNAGYGYFGAVENVTMEEARRQVEVNVFGLAALCKLVLPVMRNQGGGRIINTSSIAGKMVLPFGAWYHVTKYSVEALSDALRMEMKPFGVDVVMIEPGGIKTDWGIIAAKHLAESSKVGGVVERDGIRKGSPKRGRVDAQGLFWQLPVEAEGGDESHQPSGEQPLSSGKIQNRHGVEFAGIYAHGAPDAMVGCNDAWNDKDKTIAPRQS